MTVQQLEQHRRDLAGLWKTASRDVEALVMATRMMTVPEAREALKLGLPDVMDPFLGAASDAAAVLLDELYAITANVPASTFLPNAAKVNGLARWAVEPMVDDTLEATVLTRISGAAERMLYDSARLTTVEGVISNFYARKNRRWGTITKDANGRRVSFQRFPRAGACTFCQMLASRGDVYRTAESAGQVVGRGSARVRVAGQSGGQGGGVKARGTEPVGSTYHDACRCVVQPVIQGSPIAEYAHETRRRYEDIYRGALTSPSGKSLSDPADIMARWRELQLAA